MRNAHAPVGSSRRRVACALLTLLVLITGFPLSGAANARQADDAPIDLAAMVLRPSDLEAAGIEMAGENRYHPAGAGWDFLATGYVSISGTVEHSPVAAMPDHLIAQLYLDLADTGWQRQFRSLLTSPAEFAPLYLSTVGLYADEEGAEAAFQLLTGVDNVPDADVLDDDAGIGDESVAHRDVSNLYHLFGDRTTLTFRYGNIVGAVQVYELKPVALELVEALAERLVERIDLVLDDESGGLAHLVLRLNMVVPAIIDRYDMLDHDFLPFWYETEEEREERADGWKARIDSYQLDQLVPSGGRAYYDVPRYLVIITRFEDEAAAIDYLEGMPDVWEMEPLDDVAEFGDESLTFPEEYEWDEVAHEGFRIYTRVDDIVVNMGISAPGSSPDLGTLEGLMDIQVECLDDGACPVAEPIPAALLDFACATGPVEEADEPLGHEIEGDVPLAGGNAARTGEQPGPGPDGDPELLWRFEAAGNFNAAPVIADGLIVIGSGDGTRRSGEDGNLYALDAASGERRWCIPTDGAFFGAQAFADDLIITAQDDPGWLAGEASGIVALDPETGEEQWRVAIAGFAGDLLIDRETVFVSGAGVLTALDLETGETLWRFTQGARSDDRIDSMAIADGVVYLNYYGGYYDDPEHQRAIYAVDAETGDELWAFENNNEDQFFTGGPAVADGLVYIGATNGTLYALDAKSGDEVWQFAPEVEAWDGVEDDALTLNTPAVADGIVYVGTGSDFDEIDGDGYLFAIDAETGDELWRYETGDPLLMAPAVADGVAYVGDASGLLHAVDSESGEGIWTFELDGPLGTSGPAIVDGVLFIADRDGSLYAIAGEDR